MIVDEVRQSARGLHERLLAKLRTSIQLTSCLQVRKRETLLIALQAGRMRYPFLLVRTGHDGYIT